MLQRRIQSIETVRTSIFSAATSRRSRANSDLRLSHEAPKVFLHLEPNKQIERSFEQFVKQERVRESTVGDVKSMVRSIGKRLNDTEAMVRSAVVEHCRTNQSLKNDERLIAEADFARSKSSRNEQQFQRKFQQYKRQSRRPIDRDKLEHIIDRSREKYQKSRKQTGPFNINGLVRMFYDFEDICRRQRRPVQRRLLELQNLSDGIGLSSSRETISVDQFLKTSRIIGGIVSPSK